MKHYLRYYLDYYSPEYLKLRLQPATISVWSNAVRDAQQHEDRILYEDDTTIVTNFIGRENGSDHLIQKGAVFFTKEPGHNSGYRFRGIVGGVFRLPNNGEINIFVMIIEKLPEFVCQVKTDVCDRCDWSPDFNVDADIIEHTRP